jgi:4-amino-4-deoxy-L-arabinose transferase-like glycosyltransferase
VAAGGVLVALAGLSAAALRWFLERDYLLYYGDAQAHLNIARRLIDTRTPGYEQIGTAWLPLPHLLMAPFVQVDEWWRNGLAGGIPSAVCFVFAGTFFFLAARRIYDCGAAALAATALLALNPNLLYLQSTPMTEPVFLAALAALYFSAAYGRQPTWLRSAGAGIAALAATLTRYEGWFLVPFVALYLAIRGGRRRLGRAVLFGAFASLGPLYWLAHNWWGYSNPLEFYNGPYSALALYQRQLAAGMERAPGDGDWSGALRQYSEAARLFVSWPLVWLGAAGAAVALARRKFWPLFLLALPAVFYIMGMHSTGNPVFVPHRWPFSYYNTRYGLAALPLAALAAGALATLFPRRFRAASALVVVLAGVSYWAANPSEEAWICWKESQVNSEGRRAWTREAAAYLKANFEPGDGIIYPFGDMTAVFAQAGIPLARTLHEGNRPYWDAAVARPEFFLKERWAIVFSGDAIATSIQRAERRGLRYRLVSTIAKKGEPVVEIYRREGNASPIHQGARREE